MQDLLRPLILHVFHCWYDQLGNRRKCHLRGLDNTHKHDLLVLQQVSAKQPEYTSYSRSDIITSAYFGKPHNMFELQVMIKFNSFIKEKIITFSS